VTALITDTFYSHDNYTAIREHVFTINKLVHYGLQNCAMIFSLRKSECDYTTIRQLEYNSIEN